VDRHVFIVGEGVWEEVMVTPFLFPYRIPTFPHLTHNNHASPIPFSHPPTGTFKYQPSRLSDTTAPDVILAKAKMILNKLSVTNFHKLSDEFMGVGIDSEDLMGRAVEMIVVCAQVRCEGNEGRWVGIGG
jgi:hypothetical protein